MGLFRALELGAVCASACIALGVVSASELRAQQTDGVRHTAPATLGWDPRRLADVFEFAATLSTDTLIVMTDGQLVGSLGDLQKPHDVHSIRKALLNAVVGQHVGTGARRIDLDATLRDLGVDDEPGPLTPLQRQATVRHLLKSVSGINHPAAAEGGLTREKNRRLGKTENTPGTIWAYNNWDYNALMTIFETTTGLSVAEAFKTGIADRIGLKDFSVAAVTYRSQPEFSRHKAAMFEMSARDLATVGQLYLSGGDWRGDRVLPEGWVDRIVADHTATGIAGLRGGHGYLWWIPGPDTGLPAGTFWAWGLGQQAVFVVPAWRTVVVHQSDTGALIQRVIGLTQSQGIGMGAAFEKVALSCLEPSRRESAFCKLDRFILPREFDRLISLIVQARIP